MKRLLLISFSLAFLLSAGWLFFAHSAMAASSDDAVNYARRDAEDYNFLPLVLDPAKSTGNTGQLRDVISYNMAYDQGYEVQCASPAWNISPRVYGAIKEYFEMHSTPASFGSGAGYSLDFENGTAPLFRGDEDTSDTNKVSSFEGYFGANNQKNSSANLNSSGVANILLGIEGQCQAKYQNLRSIFGENNLCSKLEDGEQCAFDKQIAGTNFTMEQLYEKMESLFNLSNGERNLDCSDITTANPAVLAEFGITGNSVDQDIRVTQDAIAKLPLNLDILYRLAFLIISPKQNPNSGADDVFSFLQTNSPLPNQAGHSPVNEERHAPIVIGFKVPFVATNSIFSLPDLQDSARLTSTSLHSTEEVEKELARSTASRLDFINDIVENKDAKPIINCDGMPQCMGDGDTVFLQALIDMVNGSGQTCTDFRGPYEYAGDLGSPASVSEEKEFSEPYFSKVLPAANSAGFTWNLIVRDENAASQISQQKIPVTAHLITPFGSDLRFLEGSMRALFGTEELATKIQQNCIEDFNGECGMIPEFFTFGNIFAGLESQEGSLSFIYDEREDCTNPLIPIAPEDCNRLSMSGGITEQPAEVLRIMGAQVGWFIQQIQLKFRGITNRAHAYIQECKRTEDLFLGRCLGFQGDPGGKEDTVAGACVDYQDIMVDMPSSYTELGKIVCEVANNNPKDVQLLWGLTGVDGYAVHKAIREQTGSVSCGEVIMGSCGSSQLAGGVIVPQCVDREACGQVDWAFEGNAGEQYQQEITTEVACSVKGQLEWVLKKRKSEMEFLRNEYRNANGSDPSTDQLYYMMAGRNLGVSMSQLVQPGCQGAPAIDETGICAGVNYCRCVMDVLTYTCGQQV